MNWTFGDVVLLAALSAAVIWFVIALAIDLIQRQRQRALISLFGLWAAFAGIGTTLVLAAKP